eukprot:TRINITY_DN8041_c0_g1_i1.p1 TRINITY_DN8041_c0_g1~~TRINITY_DN8041_c0_g1_i1.p1  ORF type:complete len:110 (+),score=12.11 TRINITY_DN8041_c0_g1_i1:165-494(+)
MKKPSTPLLSSIDLSQRTGQPTGLIAPSSIPKAIRISEINMKTGYEKMKSLMSKLDPSIFRVLETGSETERIEGMKEIWMKMGKEGADVVVQIRTELSDFCPNKCQDHF